MVSWWTVLALAVGLAMDAFAVSIAAGIAVRQVTARHVFRVAWHFGLFQFMMPIIGWWLGGTVSARLSHVDHWVACGLLCIIGGKMLFESESHKSDDDRSCPTRGWMLMTLSIATSIDALAVGISMAFLKIDILLPCIIIGVVACTFSAIGITFGGRLLHRWGRAANIAGGLLLIVIGIRIVVSHLT